MRFFRWLYFKYKMRLWRRDSRAFMRDVLGVTFLKYHETILDMSDDEIDRFIWHCFNGRRRL